MKKIRKSGRHGTVSGHGLLAQKGLNLIEGIVRQMHSRWMPSDTGGAGVDGYIEFFDSGTGRSFGTFIAVQSRAVSSFLNDDIDSFEYSCKQSEVDYWLSGNMPVILVVSKPSSREAYWLDVRRYFENQEKRSSGLACFDKNESRFVPESFHELIRVGESADSGLYLPPLPLVENLYSNLLPVEGFPPNVFVASTRLDKPWDVWRMLEGKKRNVGGAWILREGKILSFHDLSADSWAEVCDQTTIMTAATSDYADSENPDRRRDFVELCNQTLRHCQNPKLRYWPEEDCLAFIGTLDQGTTRVSYRSLKLHARISAVTKFEGKGRNREYKWLRHMAFRGEFLRLGGKWYLEITPTYRFTRDGQNLERYHQERLRAINRSEGNRTVLSALLFWADQLSGQGDLFDSNENMLKFGKLLRLESPVGISDSEWSTRDPEDEKRFVGVSKDLILPFEGKEV